MPWGLGQNVQTLCPTMDMAQCVEIMMFAKLGWDVLIPPD